MRTVTSVSAEEHAVKRCIGKRDMLWRSKDNFVDILVHVQILIMV
jgi:hypothetical protein